ncbi:F-box family protein [Striga asiatica]|uniref:F-box family protein n=1 Tax=Striga asiatica TaxID=4170 RepID=A0A5A7QAU1_STRAF|nr:F-box family protein [Striga asiatica]
MFFSIMFPFLKWYSRRFTSFIPGFSRGAHNPLSSSSSFHRLPDDVIGRIFGNLCLGDRTRMMLVCRSWRDTLTRAEFPVRPDPPWLILPSDDPLSTSLTLESPAESRIYRFPLPRHLLPGRHRWSCRGSGDGWLLLVGHAPCQPDTEISMVLWDPLSGATRDLPPLSTLPFFDELATGCFENAGLDISSPLITTLARVCSTGPTVLVAVVFSLFENLGRSTWDRLAVCSPGDPTWAVLPNNNETNCYLDILFHNGRLFAICTPWDDEVGTRPFVSKTRTCTVGCADLEVVTCELAYEVASVEPPHMDYTGFEVWRRWSVAEHLVGSDDELLLASATLDMFTHNFDLGARGLIHSRVYNCPQTGGFEVRRLLNNSDELLLLLSERLEQTGDKCIYLGDTGSISMKGVSDEPNCIQYATSDAIGTFWNLGEEEEVDIDKQVWTIHERGVFNAAEERIRRTCSANTSARSGSCSGWFMPAAFGRQPLVSNRGLSAFSCFRLACVDQITNLLFMWQSLSWERKSIYLLSLLNLYVLYMIRWDVFRREIMRLFSI